MEPVPNRLIHELGCNLFQSVLETLAHCETRTVESTPPDTAPDTFQQSGALG